MARESDHAALCLEGDPQAAAAMVAIGERVVYSGERSPDYPDAAYRGTVVAVDDRMVTVRWDECAEWDAEECALPAGDLVRDAGASGAGGDGR